MSGATSETAWHSGRLDARAGAPRVLFGRMYEDPLIERAAFRTGARVFCIASAGCTAMHLAADHEVMAVDINPAQLAYARGRLGGAPMVRGRAEQLMHLGRALLPLAGWSTARLQTFLDFDDPAAQYAFWKTHLDTRRFRAALDALFSVAALRAAYSPELLAILPKHFGTVVRSRMERCFRTHANRTNRYARALLAGELAQDLPAPAAHPVELAEADAATFLEEAAPASFDGFTLSNILDGASDAYGQRLFRAIRRAARPNAIVVLRSFREPARDSPCNLAAQDRSMLWGVVDVRPAAELQTGHA